MPNRMMYPQRYKALCQQHTILDAQSLPEHNQSLKKLSNYLTITKQTNIE